VTAYQVLARKYRPQTFADVVGQDAVVQTLVRALDSGRVAHAFLFTGSRGVGKTTLARILARCLVCEKGVGSKPCGVCELCKGVANGSLVDVVEIDGASNNSVDQVRDLQEVARFMPQRARFRIFIIDEVHMLSTAAFNALLKILEEPPPHVKFVFATTEPHKIPVTILSRCQRYDFRRIPMKTIVSRLETVLAAEGVKALTKDALEVIARAAEGGMRDALSLTDQVLSFAGEGASAEQVTEALGIIDRRSIVSAVEACISGDAKTALAVVDNAHARGHDQRQLLGGIAEELRHMSIAAAAGSVRGFADLPDEELTRIDQRAKELDGRDLTRLLNLALEGIDPVARAEDPRIFVELTLLKMCGRPPLGDALAISEAIVRLEALAKGKPVPPLSSPPSGGGSRPIARSEVAPGLVPGERPPTTNPVAQSKVAPGLVPGERPAGTSPVARPEVAPGLVPGERPAGTSPAATSSAMKTSPPELLGEDEPIVSDVRETRAPGAVGPAPVEDEADVDAAPVAERLPGPAVVAAANDAAPEEAEEEEDIDPAAGLPLEGIDPRFKEFVDRVARAHRPIASHLDHAHLVRAPEPQKGGTVEVSFARDAHASAIKSALDAPPVREALAHAYGADVKLIIVATPAEKSAPSIAEAREAALQEAQRALEAHAKSHPIVEKAVSLFGGEVRSVRKR
jgi:DNA polymerase III subunit gamma/tau